MFEEQKEDGLVGTLEYICPEAVKKSDISFASDLWTLGIIIWQMFSSDNTTPFVADTPDETFKKIQLCNYKMPKGPNITPEILDLISKLLVKDPSQRLGADKIQNLIAHPVFKDVNF